MLPDYVSFCLSSQEESKERESQPPAPAVKPIVSAYRAAYAENRTAASAKDDHRCDICEKTFNGPQPYRSHMASRAHKEAVEDYEYNKQFD